MSRFKGNKDPKLIAEARAELLAGKPAKGVGGQVEIDGDWLTIRRKGVQAKSIHGWMAADKRIPLGNITTVQLKEPGMTRGYIRFTALGDPERNKKFMGGITDENSVMIDKKHLAAFLAIKEIVEDHIAQGSMNSPISQVPSEPVDVADQLERLAALRDSGVISDEQFVAQRDKLLSGPKIAGPEDVSIRPAAVAGRLPRPNCPPGL